MAGQPSLHPLIPGTSIISPRTHASRPRRTLDRSRLSLDCQHLHLRRMKHLIRPQTIAQRFRRSHSQTTTASNRGIRVNSHFLKQRKPISSLFLSCYFQFFHPDFPQTL